MNKKTKKTVIVLLILLLAGFFIFAYSGMHVQRNQYNKLPEGTLSLSGDKNYMDEAGVIWELQPQIKNKFHQPSGPVPPVAVPYPNVEGSLQFEPRSPNWKFLSRVEDGSGSYEAILQPDGTYLTEGKKQGTYNYGHPSGFFGIVKHTFLDVIPHFINNDYKIK